MTQDPVRKEIDALRRQRLALQDEMCFLKDQIASLDGAGPAQEAICANHAAAMSERIDALAAALDGLEQRLASLAEGGA